MEWEVLEVWVEICRQEKDGGVGRGGRRVTDQEKGDWWVGRRQISVCATGQEADN